MAEHDDVTTPPPGGDAPEGKPGTWVEGRPPRRGWSRRRLLGVAGGGAVAAAVGYVAWGRETDPASPLADATHGPSHAPSAASSPSAEPAPPATQTQGLPAARWSDPATWGGSVPGQGDVATVTQPVLLDVDAEVQGVRVEAGGALVMHPDVSRTLRSHGNILVSGTLTSRPATPAVVHRIEFVEIVDDQFVGGTSMEPVEQDVGLWVLGAGQLDLQGARKTAWTNLAAAATAGQDSITVVDATGWQVGDEVVVTPTEPATVPEHWLHHDRRTIVTVAGNQITLDAALENPHPEVTVRPGVVQRAEVLNLSRNVVVQGTPGGRSHLQFLQITTPQQVSFVGLQHLGPRKGEQEVVGRYAMHFHMDGDGSRGSVVEGAVAYDCRGHAFVAHLSNGVTFRDCVVHDSISDGYWWDLGAQEGRDSVPSNDIVYERCVASALRPNEETKFNLAGFMLGAGAGNVARGCVAVGIEGKAESSAGYTWPSHSRDDNTWVFEDNVAHNNRRSGIYYWQNGAPKTIVTRFTSFHSAQGIFAGSYANLVSYRDCTLYAHEKVGLIVNALPSKEGRRTGETITYEGMYVDQAGLSDYAVEIPKHIARGGGDRITLITGSTFLGGRVAQVGFPEAGPHPQLYDFVDCTFQGNAFWLADGLPPTTELRVQSPDTTYVIRPADQPGEPRPEWNASIAKT